MAWDGRPPLQIVCNGEALECSYAQFLVRFLDSQFCNGEVF